MKRIIPLTLLLFCSVLIAEETTGYRIVHPDGTVEFTDDATRGGEEIPLKDVQTIKSAEDYKVKQSASDTRSKPVVGYTKFDIVSPTADETLWFNEDNPLSVTLSVEPPLRSSHTILVSIDGTIRSQGKNNSLQLGTVYRGAHTIEASIVDGEGNTLITANTVTFYMRQHNIKKTTPQNSTPNTTSRPTL